MRGPVCVRVHLCVSLYETERERRAWALARDLVAVAAGWVGCVADKVNHFDLREDGRGDRGRRLAQRKRQLGRPHGQQWLRVVAQTQHIQRSVRPPPLSLSNVSSPTPTDPHAESHTLAHRSAHVRRVGHVGDGEEGRRRHRHRQGAVRVDQRVRLASPLVHKPARIAKCHHLFTHK
jgi:hypothetical protein